MPIEIILVGTALSWIGISCARLRGTQFAVRMGGCLGKLWVEILLVFFIDGCNIV